MRDNRWGIAIAGVVMQVALGAVYAWSVFRIPLTKTFGWTIPQVTLTFTIAIFVLGFAAFAGGVWMRSLGTHGPRTVALTAGVFYGLGVILASLTDGRLWWLYGSYGVLAGIGLGLGYIVPVATLVKWFPDKRGLITGIAVTGFGSGALLTAPIATSLIASSGVSRTFAILGGLYFVAVVGSALFMRNPPAGYRPDGWTPPISQQSAASYAFADAVRTWQWYGLWTLLFLNTTAGIAIISQAAPMTQEITKVDATTAASLVGIISIANGAGRLLWAWLSDAIGRRTVFLIMFPLQAAIFALLPSVDSFSVFTALAVVVLLCYGGGFGTMPAFAADYFGAENVGSIYGLMLTAWGFAGVLGPTLIATLRENNGRYNEALYLIAALMLVSTVIPAIVRPPLRKEQTASVRL
jgi:OFA family oxalate/formate antiporter-like MFS transporter